MTGAEAFGDMLRRHRERHGITLRTVAERTKIGAPFLTALERGDCSKWPAGIYSRAWIRAYAVAVGLDPDEIGGRFNRSFSLTAFPEGDLGPMTPRPADIPSVAPLRLTLAADPGERQRRLVTRALYAVLDLAVLALLAAVTGRITGQNAWVLFAAAAMAVHAAGVFAGGAVSLWLWRRAHRRPTRDDSEESAVAEPA